MPTKVKDWRADFRRLLAPKILRALKDDRAGKVPLKPAQRREALKLLRFGMSTEEIRAALAGRRKTGRRVR